jgi:hypothetical protein
MRSLIEDLQASPTCSKFERGVICSLLESAAGPQKPRVF